MASLRFGASLALLCALVFASAHGADQLYDDKYDYINVDEIIANSRIRNQYFKCFLDMGPCLTPDAKFFKDHFAEALVTKCRRCTERQKDAFEKLVVYYTEKEPENWRMALMKAIADSKKKKNNN